MKNRNNQLTAILFVVAFALASIVQAGPRPDGGPIGLSPNEAPRPDGGPATLANERVSANSEASSAYSTSPDGENLPVITIHATGDVSRGKTGAFVLNMNPRLMFGGIWVNFSVSGTAIPGVDYVPLVSPAYIGQSGYGAILVQTLPDPRASSSRQAYSVVVTLEAGAGYGLGAPNSATMWIKASAVPPPD
jgi:hypothetical protein